MDLDRDPRGEPATDRLNYTAYRLGRALDRFTENLSLSHGVTLSQFLVLQVLGEGLPLSNAQLGRRTFVSSQAAHLVANELLELGLVRRGSHPTNRRIRLVQLTKTGWDLVQTCTQELRDHQRRLTEAVGEDLGNSIVAVLDHAARELAGGYFGDDEAEAEAVTRRQLTSRPRHVPSRLAASRLKALDREANGTPPA
ncbi:DNA-binding transcriptional regulator, MarR family [Brevibacterium sandarakinum]|uniref:DNA-binding transcriptional regulator, MarR family n=1 Tax=Brevibacterium sandarakinum TaxID=629680 RepID=A0A1H1QQI2_BRESA|nr:DNA-binding transcriptional regulator, MarR family [Brevibacterium sandarakinum]